MIRTRLTALAVALMALLALSATLVAPAATAGKTSYHDRMAAALERVADRQETVADMALIRANPTIAAQVPDWDNYSVTTTTGTGAPPAPTGKTFSFSGDGWYGTWVRVTITQRGATGAVIYAWTHHAEVNRGGGRIINWVNRYDYLSQSSDVVDMKGLVADSASPAGGTYVDSFRQRHIQYCVLKYGCYTNVYPYSSIRLWQGGYYSWNGSN